MVERVVGVKTSIYHLDVKFSTFRQIAVIEFHLPRSSFLFRMGVRMKKLFLFGLVALVGISQTANADSNAGGGIVNSESINLGSGPFNHGAPVGSGDNTIVTPTFVGGFNANRIRFSGTLTSLISGTFASEADIRVTLGANFFDWQNPGGAVTFTTQTYNSSQALTGALLNANPAGTWSVQFFDSFNDGAGADSRSNDVIMTFEEALPTTDSNGVFGGPTFNATGSYNSVGEFAVAQTAGLNGNHDRYSFTLGVAGTLDYGTTATPGFTGLVNGDTEIAIFDGSGNFVVGSDDDDNGPGLYSLKTGLSLAAGNYTLVVGDFSTTWGATLATSTYGSAPAAGYDYGLFMNFTSAVPEPSSLAALGLLGLAFGFRRRRS